MLAQAMELSQRCASTRQQAQVGVIRPAFIVPGHVKSPFLNRNYHCRFHTLWQRVAPSLTIRLVNRALVWHMGRS
jgi:hypothetical protein